MLWRSKAGRDRRSSNLVTRSSCGTGSEEAGRAVNLLLLNQYRFGYESTVGAGTPFIAAIKRIAMGGDVVRSINGTFSGTIGFITSGLDDGKKVR